MQAITIGNGFEAGVTQMRVPGQPELLDGNTLPRLCELAGAGACAQACQLRLEPELFGDAGKRCAEKNITDVLEEYGIAPENFAIVSATKDRVGFADSVREFGYGRHTEDKYATIPNCNAFFFRPGKDTVPDGQKKIPLTHIAMRMADCAAVVYEMKDVDGNDVVGLAHFSRTNMRGPSAYIHEIDGRKVSWAEYVLTTAVRKYKANPATVKVRMVAAVEGKDFIHSYKDEQAMMGHYPGWAELGFMHPRRKRADGSFDCKIDYREMVRWQLVDSLTDPALQLRRGQVSTRGAVNTGNPRGGYASHHRATKGEIPHGRDMYMLGLNAVTNVERRIRETGGRRSDLFADWIGLPEGDENRCQIGQQINELDGQLHSLGEVYDRLRHDRAPRLVKITRALAGLVARPLVTREITRF